MAATEQISDCFNRLIGCLSALDQRGIEICVAELDGMRDQFPAECLRAADLAVLMFQIRQAKELATAASNLYSGWIKIAEPPALAYLPGGPEPSPHTPALTLTLEA